jgi:RimJ/RimL family protein N-acetyltransferase
MTIRAGREQTAASLAKMSADWAERGFGLFAAEVRETGALAGWVGFAVPEFLPEVLPAVEIGWRLGRAYRVCASSGGPRCRYMGGRWTSSR